MPKIKYICSKCRSEDVFVKEWINPNTNEVLNISNNEDEDVWCNSCKDNIPLFIDLVPETSDEFNSKFKEFLAKGHYGCAISNKKMLEYLNSKFLGFSKNPNFKYFQIKSKFNDYCFYCEGISHEVSYEIEKKLKEIEENEKN